MPKYGSQHGQPKMFASLSLRKHFGRVPEHVMRNILPQEMKKRAYKDDKKQLT
jgi:hypothetical protein